MRIQRVVLEDHRDVAVLRVDLVDDALADLDFAGGDVLEAGDHPQQRALAAAGWPDQHDELFLGDIEVDAVDDFVSFVGFAHMAQGYCGHADGSWVGQLESTASLSPAASKDLSAPYRHR